MSIFFKSKQRCFSKKNKNKRVATRFLIGFCRANPPGHTGFFPSLFFFNPARFQSWVDPPGQAKFQNHGIK
jgi:hypothetical protein